MKLLPLIIGCLTLLATLTCFYILFTQNLDKSQTSYILTCGICYGLISFILLLIAFKSNNNETN